MNKLLSEEPQ